jgi:hypothetical protein
MGSYSVYKLLWPSAKNGTRLRIPVEWMSNRQEALRYAKGIRDRVCDDVQAVVVVDFDSGGEVIFRAECGNAELAS